MRSVVDDAILREITTEIVTRFDPERIVLFGSRARGDHRPDSDYDLMVVLEDRASDGQVADAIRNAVAGSGRHIDVIVDTSARFERRRTDVGTLAYAADVDGRVLYERSPLRTSPRVREPAGPPESLAEWLGRAERDWLAMNAMVHDERLTDVAAFHAHQCAEKYLKAVLVFAGVRPPRTHLLSDVLAQSVVLRDRASVREACSQLDRLFPATRYPELPPPTAAEATLAATAARVVRTASREVL